VEDASFDVHLAAVTRVAYRGTPSVTSKSTVPLCVWRGHGSTEIREVYIQTKIKTHSGSYGVITLGSDTKRHKFISAQIM
jgi:hypothetical protein